MKINWENILDGLILIIAGISIGYSIATQQAKVNLDKIIEQNMQILSELTKYIERN